MRAHATPGLEDNHEPEDYDALLNLIGTQKTVYDELLQLSWNKKDAIVTGDVSRLETVLEAEELLLLHLGGLEKRRELMVISLSSPCSDGVTGPPARALQGMTLGQKKALDDLQTSFSRTLEAVSQVNEVNRQLLQMHLDYVQQVIDETTLMVRTTSYAADGCLSLRRDPSARLFEEIV